VEDSLLSLPHNKTVRSGSYHHTTYSLKKYGAVKGERKNKEDSSGKREKLERYCDSQPAISSKNKNRSRVE